MNKFSKSTALVAILSFLFMTTVNPAEETHSGFSQSESLGFRFVYANWIPSISVTLGMMDQQCASVRISPAADARTAKSYTYQISTNSGMTNAISRNVTGIGDGTAAVDEYKGLALNTTYYYRVRANDGLSNDWSKISSIKTGATPAIYSCL